MTAPKAPKLQRVEWLIEALNLDNRSQAYDIVASKKIPDDCVLRFGRRIRIVEDKLIAWLNAGCPDSSIKS